MPNPIHASLSQLRKLGLRFSFIWEEESKPKAKSSQGLQALLVSGVKSPHPTENQKPLALELPLGSRVGFSEGVGVTIPNILA